MPDAVATLGPPERNLNAPPPPVASLESVAATAEGAMALTPPALAPLDDSRVRASISYWLLALLTATIVLAFIATAFILADPVTAGSSDIRFDQLLRVLNVVFGPIIALVSSVVGFYFGARTVAEAKAGG